MPGVSSISGSASSGSEDSEPEPERGKPLSKLSRQLNDTSLSSDEEADELYRRRRAHLRTAIIWFSPSHALDTLGIPLDTQLGTYRALFPLFNKAEDYLNGLRRMQLFSDDPAVISRGNGGEYQERRITLLMVAGGHFAGMVVRIRPKAKNEKQEVKGAGDVKVLKHKTFHRYTSKLEHAE